MVRQKEKITGNIEYKRHLCFHSHHKLIKYGTQLKYRVVEGNGKAFYLIGVDDDGSIYGIHKSRIPYTLTQLESVCSESDCKLQSFHLYPFGTKYIIIAHIHGLFSLEEYI